jgi:hypothetical protein
VASTAKDEAANVAGTAADQASQVAGAAGSAAADVAGTAKAEAANVIGEGLDQARDLVSTVRDQVGEQVSNQSDRLTESLRTLSTQLSEGDTSGVVGQVLQEAGTRLSKLADYAERTGPQGIVTELRSYARRNPGTFLLGAALTGLVTGRVVKGISAGKQSQPALPPSTHAPIGGTAAGNPLAGVTAAPGTGVAAGYTPSPLPGSTYTPEPLGAEAYPATPEPLTTPLGAGTYGTATSSTGGIA